MAKTKLTGMERRRRVGASAERKERAEVAVFHELGKGLTSSPQLDQGLRTIVEKIDEFLMRTPGLCCFVDEVQQELYCQRAIGKNAHGRKGGDWPSTGDSGRFVDFVSRYGGWLVRLSTWSRTAQPI